MWRATVAGVVLRHEPIGSLIRGRRRDPALPDIRGSGPLPGAVRAGDGTARMVDAAPDPWNLTRFLPALTGVEEDPGPVSGMGSATRTALMAELPGSGRRPGHDGKAIAGHSTGRKDGGAGRTPGPGAARGRHGTAGAGAKTGRPRRKVKGRSGYTPHVIAGTTCGIPVGISVQPAPVPEAGEPERMSGSLMAEAPDLAGRRGTSSAGRGPGSGPLERTFRDGWETRPAIDTRLMWSAEKREPGYDPPVPITRPPDPERADTTVHGGRGGPFRACPETGGRRDMAFEGFGRDRQTPGYRCPAAAYGFGCQGRAACPRMGGGKAGDHRRAVRVPPADPDTGRRVFTPVPWGSPAWRKDCSRRSAPERTNARVDRVHGMGTHLIRGPGRMSPRRGPLAPVMMAMAPGHVRAGRPEMMRPPVRVPIPGAA